MREQLPIGIYRARGALQRLRAAVAAGRLTPGRSEPFLLQHDDPSLRAALQQAIAERVARIAEGPGQHDPGLLPAETAWWPVQHDRTTVNVLPPTVCDQCEHVDGHAPDCPVAPISLGTFRDHMIGWLGPWRSTIDSITVPDPGSPALRVRLFSGQTIEITLREVPE